jgi:pseudouridine kinase
VTDILCIGGAIIDRKYQLHGPLVPGSSNPGHVSITQGGVARNIAENLARLCVHAGLAAAIGDDEGGKAILSVLAGLGVDTSAMVIMDGHPTSEYAAILEAGTRELALAVVAMDEAETHIAAALPAILRQAAGTRMIFADANLPIQTMQHIMDAAGEIGFSLAVDAVSVVKAQRLPMQHEGIDFLFMNVDEAAAILAGNASSPLLLATEMQKRGARQVVITAGSAGAFFADAQGALHVPAIRAKVADVTGAGDSLVATMLWRLSFGDQPIDALRWGVLAAGLTVESTKSVRPDLSQDYLRAERWRIDGL